jgi:HEAT repeats
MTCDEARLQFGAVLEGSEDAASVEFSGHVASCTTCREQLDTLRTHWAALGLLGDSEPSSNLRRNFYQSLSAYQEGVAETRSGGRARWWQAWWPARPALQIAFSVLLIVAGTGIGYITSSSEDKNSAESAHLRSEIAGLRQLVTLSLLQQQSPVDRLQGVTWSYRVEHSDMEVLDALLRIINEDANIDVRLAAVDAFRGFSKNPVARRGLLQSLGKQTSPLMRIAVIDLLTQIQERSAAPQIQRLLEDPALDQNVRRRAQLALRRLE